VEDDEREEVAEARSGDYRVARISAATALTLVLGFIVVLDAFSPTYQVSEIVVGALIAGVATLLGIEGLSAFRRD
jgi:hypothetical protein